VSHRTAEQQSKLCQTVCKQFSNRIAIKPVPPALGHVELALSLRRVDLDDDDDDGSEAVWSISETVSDICTIITLSLLDRLLA